MNKLRADILNAALRFVAAKKAGLFVAGKTPIPPALQMADAAEALALIEVALEGRFAGGKRMQEFEEVLGRLYGGRAIVVNSGSSANLAAISALMSPLLGERRLRAGDEVVTAACGFPTTLAPILQNGLVPVYVDIDLPTYNPSLERIRHAIGPRTRAIFLAHMLGNPFWADALRAFADKSGLWFIEDCCDAMGSMLGDSPVGTFGHLATFSFYPAHHISTGEGGAVVAHDKTLGRIVASLRDWGRDCVCIPGCDNTCGNRFGQQFGTLPQGYDHKYTFSHIGYNLRATEMQAALGLVQVEKLCGFVEARHRNFRVLRAGLRDLQNVLVLPEAAPRSEPSWFGFPLCVCPEAPFSRNEIVRFLDDRHIGVRLMFGGNLTRQPAFEDAPGRIAGPLVNTDFVMNNGFWIGVHPGLTTEMIQYLVDSLHEFCGRQR